MKLILLFSILLVLITTFSASPIVLVKLQKVPDPSRDPRSVWDDWLPSVVTPNAGTRPVNQDSWFCGSNGVQMKTSHVIVGNSCPEKMPELNHCCAVHDSCYDNESHGREKCDDEFCECLDFAMRRTPNLPGLCTTFTTNTACTLVDVFGASSYGRRNANHLESRAFHPALNQTANLEYNRLYLNCPEFGKPLTSCAYNHLACTVKILPEERYNQEYTDCRDQLISCMEHASVFLRIKETSEKCFEQMQIALDAVKDDARLSGMDASKHYVNLISTTLKD